jgi:hypothetical protein
MKKNGNIVLYLLTSTVLSNTTLQCMDNNHHKESITQNNQQEELQLTPEQIQQEMQVTRTLAEAKNVYTDVFNRLRKIFPYFGLEEELRWMITDLDSIYINHLMKHMLKMGDNQELFLSGIDILRAYYKVLVTLIDIIQSTEKPKSKSFLPSLFHSKSTSSSTADSSDLSDKIKQLKKIIEALEAFFYPQQQKKSDSKSNGKVNNGNVNKEDILHIGTRLLQAYCDAVSTLATILEEEESPLSDSSLPSMFSNKSSSSNSSSSTILLDNLKNIYKARKLLKQTNVYLVKLAQGSQLQERFADIKKNIESIYKITIQLSGLWIEQFDEDKEAPTCPKLLVEMVHNYPLGYEKELKDLTNTYIKKNKKHKIQKKALSNLSQHKRLENLQKKWNKTVDDYTSHCVKILQDNFFSVLKQLHKIKQFAKAIRFNSDDGGIRGLDPKRNPKHLERIKTLESNLLLFAFPYMNQEEEQIIHNVQYQPAMDGIGFITTQMIFLDNTEFTIYLENRETAIKEVLLSLVKIEDMLK